MPKLKINLPVTQVEKFYIKGDNLVSKTDLSGVITDVNAAFIRMSGYSRAELLGENHNLMRHPDMPPQVFADLWETITKGHPWRGIVKNRCKNGDHFWVDIIVVPTLKNDQAIGYAAARSEPSRERIEKAAAWYEQLNGVRAQ